MGSSLAPVLDERRAGLAQVVHRGPADEARHTARRVRVGYTRETRPTWLVFCVPDAFPHMMNTAGISS